MPAVIRIGYIDRGSQKAAAVEVENLLTAHGHRILRQRATRAEMFDILRRDGLDLLVSAWLPDSDAELVARSGEALVPLATLYEPRYIWGVPRYVLRSEIAAISDLARPDVRSRIGAGIEAVADPQLARLSRTAMARYGLEQAGFTFREVPEDDRIGRFVEDVAERKWAVLPVWQPHWLHHRYGIRALDDPLGALGPIERATLMASRTALERIGEPTVAALTALHFGNARMNELDDHLQPWD